MVEPNKGFAATPPLLNGLDAENALNIAGCVEIVGVGRVIDFELPKENCGGLVELPGGFIFKNAPPNADVDGVDDSVFVPNTEAPEPKTDGAVLPEPKPLP